MMEATGLTIKPGCVALCEEGVDRNNVKTEVIAAFCAVALCEEGVDRNADLLQMRDSAQCRPLRRGRG